MTLSEKVAHLYKHREEFSGYMKKLIEDTQRIIQDGRIQSIGYNTEKFIDRAFWSLTR